MIIKYNPANPFIVLTETVTEMDFKDSIIVVKAGINCIGCNFDNCKVFIEDIPNRTGKFTRCNFTSRQDVIPIASFDKFIKTFTKGVVP
jgi:hypothetical protein